MRGYQRGRPSTTKSSGGGGGMKSHLTNISRNVKSLESKMKQRQHDYNSRGRQQQPTTQHTNSNQRQRSNSANNNKKQSDKKQLLMINYSKHYEQQQSNNSVSSSDSGTDIVPPYNNNTAAPPTKSQRGRTSKLSRPSFIPRVGRHTNKQQQDYEEEEFHMSGGANYFTPHNNSSSNNNRPRITNRLKRLHNPNGSEWILPINYKYNKRIDIWLLLSISSCAALSSIGLVFSSSSSVGIGSSPKYALSTCIVCFIISLIISIGLRYAPLRMGLTTNIMPLPTLSSYNNQHLSSQHHSNSKRCLSKGQKLLLYKMNITYELLVLSLLVILWISALPIIVNGEVYYMVSFVCFDLFTLLSGLV